MEKEKTELQKYAIPLSIIVAGVIVAGAILWSQNATRAVSSGASVESAREPSISIRTPNKKTDHIRGNIDAPITIVEFSDLECPFCARIHPTLQRIIEEQNDTRWVYRHFPLSSIHSNALSAALASECIAQLGSNDHFWSFVDSVFANQENLGDNWYRETAASIGIGTRDFENCMQDSKIASRIRDNLDEATGTGGRGTPYIVVITPKGNLMPFSGALPYEQVSAFIDQARNN